METGLRSGSKARWNADAVTAGAGSGAGSVADLRERVERTVAPMGYELVEVEFGQRGLLRVFIDSTTGVRLEDCEQVSRQLSRVFAVDDIDYDRLEVSSPGLDRPLRRRRDFERFVASPVTLRLRQPFQGRRNFEGILTAEADERFGLELTEAAPARGAAVAKAAKAAKAAKSAARERRAPTAAVSETPAPVRKLVFSLDEVERARLVPIVKF